MTAVEGGEGRLPRGRAAVGWSEFSTRYLLLEGMLKDRRVLEIGTFDPRSLLRLHDLGAARVIGCTSDAARFDRSRFPSRSIELISMDPGRIDFGDAAFDVVLVVDLSIELAHNPRFLGEVRRVLAKDGFAMLAFPANGRSLTDLVDEEDHIPVLPPSRLEDGIREVFPGARFYGQAPFVGVAIEPEGRRDTEMGVSLEPSTDATPPRPSHVLALVGRGLPELHDRTLVELPFLDFEAMAEAERARTTADQRRLLAALSEAKQQIRRRDDSLRQIHERLPKLRSAFEKKLRALGSDRPSGQREVVTPTVLERPTEDPETGKRLKAEVDSRIGPLEERLSTEKRRREQAEARIRELEVEADLLERQLKASLPQPSVREEVGEWASAEPGEATELPFAATIIESATTIERADRSEVNELYERLRAREATLAATSAALQQANQALEREKAKAEEQSRATTISGPSPEASEEADRRIEQLERTASLQEQRIEELLQEIESHKEVRHALGADVKDSEARHTFLQRRVEEEQAARAELERRAEERLQAVTEALNRADQEKETIRERLQLLESDQRAEVAEAIEAAAAQVRRDFQSEQSQAEDVRDRLYSVERELHQRSNEVEELQRRLTERESRQLQLTQHAGNLEAEKRALELAAGHLSRETETLKARVAELRQERDTLAATSQLLLAERDTAARLAKQALDAETEAMRLSRSLEAAEQNIERLEADLARAEAERGALQDKLINLSESEKRRGMEAQELRAKLEPLQAERRDALNRIGELDQRMATLQQALQERTKERDRAIAGRAELEAMVREAAISANVAVREAQAAEAERDTWAALVGETRLELGQVLAARAKTEADALMAIGAYQRARGEKAILEGEKALLVAAKVRLETKLEQSLSEMVGLEDELSRLLDQAPAVSTEELVELKAALEEAVSLRRDAEIALARTLSEAARVSTELIDRDRELKSLSAQLEKGERERLEIERARRQAEESRRSTEAARAHAVSDAKAANDRVTRLEFEQRALEQALEAKSQEVRSLLRTVEAKEREKEALAAELEARVATEQERGAQHADLEELQQKLVIAKEIAAAREQDLVEAQRQIEVTQEQLIAFEVALGEAQGAVTEARQARERAELERLAQAALVVEERTSALAARIAAEELEHDLALARDRLADLRRELSVLKAVEALGRASDPPAGEVEGLRQRLRELETALAHTQPSVAVDDDQVAIDWARKEATRLDWEKLLKARTALQAQVAHLEGVVAIQEANALARDAAAAELAAMIERQTEALLALERELADSQQGLKVTFQQAQIDRLRADSAEAGGQRLEAALAESETRTAALGAQVHQAERRAETLADQLAQVEQALAETRRAQEEADRRLDEAQAGTGALDLKLEDAEARAGELEAEVESLRSTINEQATALRATEEAKAEAERQKQSLLAGTLDLQSQLDVVRTDAQRATQDLISFEGEKAILAETIARLESKVTELSAHSRALESALAEAKASAPPPEDLRRLISRAGELEVRAEKAEKERDRINTELAAKGLREAQAIERATRAEERAAQKEERLKKEETRAIDAEERARHAEILSREVETRARDLEGKRRTLEARALAAEGKAEHAERLTKQAEAQVKQLEARLKSAGEEVHRRAEVAEQRASEAETRLERTRSESSARLGELEGKLNNFQELSTARDAQRHELERTKSELDTLRSKLHTIETSGGGEDTMALRGRCRSLEQMVSQRDGELKRLTGLAEKVARELDEARADVGRKLAEIRQNREGLEFVRRQLGQSRAEAELLRAKLEQSGDAAELKVIIEAKDQELARVRAGGLSDDSERHRLKAMIQASEQAQVVHERRIAELEAAAAERNQRIELLRRDLADKTERLKRLSGQG